MTTIAYRDGVLAADSQSSCGHVRQAGKSVKIAQGPDGSMGGGAGTAAFCEAWLAWVRGDTEEMPTPEASQGEDGGDGGLLIHPDGTIEVFEHGGSYKVDAPYFAEGTGSSVALGAMHHGATAEEAVRAAIAHDVFTGGDVLVLQLPGKPA